MGDVVPCVINVYDDRSFDFIVKVSPMSRLILKKIRRDKGPSKNTVYKLVPSLKRRSRGGRGKDARSQRCFNRSGNEDGRRHLLLNGY